MAVGVPLGAMTAKGDTDSKSGRPDAATVGTPGANGEGSLLPTASALNRPCFTYGMAAGAPGNIRCTSPVISATTAGPVPL